MEFCRERLSMTPDPERQVSACDGQESMHDAQQEVARPRQNRQHGPERQVSACKEQDSKGDAEHEVAGPSQSRQHGPGSQADVEEDKENSKAPCDPMPPPAPVPSLLGGEP